MGDVFALAVIELLKAKGIGVEIVEQSLDALFHVNVGERLRLVLLLNLSAVHLLHRAAQKVASKDS